MMAIWDKIHCILWAAAVGLAVGAGLFAWAGGKALWAVLLLAAAAAAAGALIRRARPEVKPIERAPNVPVLSPLARETIEQLPDPLMMIDASEKILFANRAMRDAIGANGEVERKPVASLLRMPSVFEALTHTTATGEAASTEFSIRVPVERHFQAYTAKVGDKHPVIVLLLHDLTALKRAEQTRVDFVANASHELRTPLAAVSGFIETLKGPARDDPEARDRFLDIMLVEAERMRRLIEDLLSLSRIELNEHVTPRDEVAMENLVQEAVAALGPLAKAEDMKVVIDAEENLPKVAGERDELIQLLQNLIHNAIKYGREHGTVAIGLRKTSAAGRSNGNGRGKTDLVAISIKDDGEGIPQEAIPRLTERFYRVDVKRSREKGGTGLGLAIVKHIVNRHGGKLQVESRLGEGSTFTVILPAARKPLEKTEKIADSPAVTEV
jgi:two-component system, OmpR family, phosphate regulon sensor histidine kinase PhoR